MMANAVFITTQNGYQKGSEKVNHRDEIRKNSLTIPMSKEEKDAVREAARREGMTMATFIRNRIIKLLREEVN